MIRIRVMDGMGEPRLVVQDGERWIVVSVDDRDDARHVRRELTRALADMTYIEHPDPDSEET